MQVLVVQNNAAVADKKANFEKVENLLSQYNGEKPDLIAFPEVWTLGWKPELFIENAEEENSQTESFLCTVAKKFNTLIVGGSYIRKKDGCYYNTCPIITPEGKICARYDKMHLFFADGEQKFLTRGSESLLLVYNGIKIGISVCYDIRFGELFKNYDADILVNCACWPNTKANHWITLSKARAIENQAYYVAANQCGKIDENNTNLGYSMLISPWGEIIKSAQYEECVINADFNLKTLKDLREKYPYKNDIHPIGYKQKRVIHL